MRKIKLLLADDHAVLRAGLKTLFENQPDIEVIAEAGDGHEAVAKALATRPDMVLMDITMPGLTGLEATREIKRQQPDIKILALTVHEDEHYMHQMLRAGADGYLPKKAVDTELLDAVRATCRGENFIHSSMTTGIVSNLRQEVPSTAGQEPVDDKLTNREREVLRLLALGHTNQHIADMLYLSVKTVETHKARLKVKLGIKGRADLVRYAMRQGLLETDG